MKNISRNDGLLWMPENTAPSWTFLTNHAQVLVCIARDPGVRLRDIGDRVGITERAAHRIVVELEDAGYITRERNGRRNSYTVNAHSLLPDPVARGQNVGELLELLTATHEPNRRAARGGASTRSRDWRWPSAARSPAAWRYCSSGSARSPRRSARAPSRSERDRSVRLQLVDCAMAGRARRVAVARGRAVAGATVDRAIRDLRRAGIPSDRRRPSQLRGSWVSWVVEAAAAAASCCFMMGCS